MIHDRLLNPMAWIFIMLALHAAVRAWQWTRHETGRTSGRQINRWAESFYLAGIPIAAVALRVIPSVGHMGLDIPDRPAVTIGVGLLAALLVCTIVTMWEAGWRTADAASRLAHALRAGRVGREKIIGIVRRSLEFELHWAFFRAAALSAGLNSLGNGGIGAAMWLSIVLLGIEGWSNPATRAALTSPSTARPIARSAALAIGSILAFALSGSSASGLIAQVAARYTLALMGDFDGDRVRPIDLEHVVAEPIVVG